MKQCLDILIDLYNAGIIKRENNNANVENFKETL